MSAKSNTSPTTRAPEKIARLVEDFEQTEDFDTRLEMLVELAEQFEEVPAKIATRPFPEQHRVPGCESEAYIWVETLPSGGPKFYFAIENPQGLSAKAMATILDQTLSGESWESIDTIDPQIVYSFFGKNISMGKGRGLMEMVGMVKLLAKRELGQRAS